MLIPVFRQKNDDNNEMFFESLKKKMFVTEDKVWPNRGTLGTHDY